MEVPCNTGDKKVSYCIVLHYYPPVKIQPPAFCYHGLKSPMPSVALYVILRSLLFSSCYVLNT